MLKFKIKFSMFGVGGSWYAWTVLELLQVWRWRTTTTEWCRTRPRPRWRCSKVLWPCVTYGGKTTRNRCIGWCRAKRWNWVAGTRWPRWARRRPVTCTRPSLQRPAAPRTADTVIPVVPGVRTLVTRSRSTR